MVVNIRHARQTRDTESERTMKLSEQVAALDGPITQDEMIAMFGERMPIEAVNLVWESPGEMTLREIRQALREMAAQRTKSE